MTARNAKTGEPRSSTSVKIDGPKIDGEFAYAGLDRIIHERARLSILASLAAHPSGLLFNDLKRLCDLTDGNLSRQLQSLQSAGFVEIWKGTKNNRPQTLCRLTPAGQTRFADYIDELERVVQDAARAATRRPATPRPLPAT